jgi:nucleoside-diphosphate-sugar epimerase
LRRAWFRYEESFYGFSRFASPVARRGLRRFGGEVMRIFATGATGYVGSAVSARLLAAGHAVAALARSDAAAARLRAAGIEPVAGDLADADVIERETRRADAVVHAAFEQSRRAVEVDRLVVQAVVRAAEGSGKAFVYTSGTAVVGDTGSSAADESTPLDPAGPVAWRAAHEAMVTEAASRGVRGIVFRPSLVYGRGGGSVRLDVERARRDGVARFVGDGANCWSTVHVDDLADLYVLALRSALAGSVWMAEGGESVSMRELAEAVSRAAGADGRTAGLSTDEAKAHFGWAARLLALNLVVSADRARRQLGWEPSRPALLSELASGAYAPDGG